MRTIITDSIRNVNRVIRRSNYSGHATFGTQVVTAVGLAWQIILEKRSAEGLCNIRMISDSTAASIVLGLLTDDTDHTFNPNSGLIPAESLCLATAREVLVCMNLLRTNNRTSGTPENAEDIDRINYLDQLIERYEQILKEKNLYDGPLALKEALELGNSSLTLGIIETCYFGRVSTLEQKFVSGLGTVSGAAVSNGTVSGAAVSGGAISNGTVSGAAVSDRAVTEFNKPAPGKITYKFVKTYGIVNEADYVARTIIAEKIPLGDTEIICDTAIYAPFIEEAFAKRGLKFNFTTPVSVAGLYQVRLIKDLISWYISGCKYQELFNVMHNPLFVIKTSEGERSASNPYLKGISYGIGWGAERYQKPKPGSYDAMHLAEEPEINKQFREIELPELGKLAQIIEEALKAESVVTVLDTLLEYAKSHIRKVNRENRFITSAFRMLRKNLSESMIKFSDENELLDYLLTGLDSLSYCETESGDAVNVSSIHMIQLPERKHIFVIGLSAAEFKISTSESPLLSDDLKKELFGDPVIGNITLAEQAIDDAERILRTTIEGAPSGSIVTLIASQADVMRDGSGVAASSIFEKLRTEAGANCEDETGYYDITRHNIRVDHDNNWGDYDSGWEERTGKVSLTFSKSSLDEFLQCPLRYHYDKSLHINKEEYTTYDPGAWLEHKDKGTLIHGILETYAKTVLIGNTKVDRAFDREATEFTEAVRIATEAIEQEIPAPNEEIKDKELTECVDIAADYLTYLHQELHDDGWEVWKCEEEIDPEKSGSTFTINDVEFDISYSGRIDRIDRRATGNGEYVYRIIDYKTGKTKSAEKMKADTKQHLIYADYIVRNFGKVESFEYQFLGHMTDKEEDWIACIEAMDLQAPVFSDEPGKRNMSEQDHLYAAFAQHDYRRIGSELFPDGIPVEKRCDYCQYMDICLYGLYDN